jgi:hypothetical protein
MKNSFSSTTGALIFLIVLLAHSSNAFACACCFNGEVPQTFTLGTRTDDLWAYPYGDQQAKGALRVIEDTAKKILYEGGRPEANIELGGEAKNISAYAPELKP